MDNLSNQRVPGNVVGVSLALLKVTNNFAPLLEVNLNKQVREEKGAHSHYSPSRVLFLLATERSNEIPE